MASINIITVLGKGAVDYANLLYKTGEYFKSGKHEINWLAVTTAKCREVPKGFIKAHDLEVHEYETGVVHSEGLMAGLKASNAEFIMFSDVDIIITEPAFDEKLLEKFSGKIAVVGAEWGGEHEKECYQNFPCITFSMFKSDIAKKLNVDLHQGTRKDPHLHTRQIRNKRLSDIFARSPGKNFLLETGWKLPYYYKRAGYEGYTFQKICPRNKKAQLPWPQETAKPGPKSDKPYRTRKRWITRKFGDHIMHEFHLEGKMIATHLRRSRKYLMGSKLVEIWLDRIRLHFKQKYNADII